MTDDPKDLDLSRLSPEQVRRILRAKSGPPSQRLNAATQAQIDATLQDTRPAKPQPTTRNDFGGV